MQFFSAGRPLLPLHSIRWIPRADTMTPRKTTLTLMIWASALAPLAWPQTRDLVPVVSKQTSRTADLPGEFLPFLSVSLHAKVPGYVERILVDRGSRGEGGQLLAELGAPEMAARIAESE